MRLSLQKGAHAIVSRGSVQEIRGISRLSCARREPQCEDASAAANRRSRVHYLATDSLITTLAPQQNPCKTKKWKLPRSSFWTLAANIPN
jgi:hypothetical protein